MVPAPAIVERPIHLADTDRMELDISAGRTHEVLNQPPPLHGTNPFTTDQALREAVVREGAGWATDELTAFGELTGREEVIRLGHLANRYPPELRTHDRFGHRIEEDVEAVAVGLREVIQDVVGDGVLAARMADADANAHEVRAHVGRDRAQAVVAGKPAAFLDAHLARREVDLVVEDDDVLGFLAQSKSRLHRH